MWKAVEAEVGKIRIGKTKRKREEKRKRKKKTKEGKDNGG